MVDLYHGYKKLDGKLATNWPKPPQLQLSLLIVYPFIGRPSLVPIQDSKLDRKISSNSLLSHCMPWVQYGYITQSQPLQQSSEPLWLSQYVSSIAVA